MKRGLLIASLLVSFLAVNAQTDSARSAFRTNFLVPTVGVGMGLYSRINNVPLNKYKVYDFTSSKFSNFNTSLDDYFQFAPIGIAYALELTKLESRSKFFEKSAALVGSHLIMSGIVYPMKYLIGDQRPITNERTAFPSGHTAEAFLAAQFLWREYGYKYKWIGYLGYGFAGATGLFRILNNRHWSADVFAGAGIGILSVNLAYLCTTWYKKRHMRRRS